MYNGFTCCIINSIYPDQMDFPADFDAHCFQMRLTGAQKDKDFSSKILFLQKNRWCRWGQGETSNEKQDKEHKEKAIKS